MIVARFGMLGALALMPVIAQVSNPSFSEDATATERIARRQLGPIRDKVDHLDGTSDSTNWSGYAVLGTSFTSAKASWTVPAAVCTGVSGDQYAASWVGIDGYSSSTVEQTGTLTECVGTRPSYYAWYEFYPKPMYEITSVPVSPGNVITATVTYSGSEFTVTIANESTGKSYSKSSRVSGAARSSAEWILEAPCCTSGGGILPLADFGTSGFGLDYTSQAGTNYATDSSTSGAIAKFASPVQITKIASSSSPQTSTCSILSSDGTSFSCTWAK